MPNLPPPDTIHHLVATALQEDIGTGDLTAALISPHEQATASLICREPAILCGTAWFEQTFHQLDNQARLTWNHSDGTPLTAGTIVCHIHARARALLTAERTALNLIQTLTGTATATRRYVDAVAGTSAKIIDTRKTLPGMRLAQKYATAVGGAINHRLGLYDQLLIKENHIAAAGSIAVALHRARATSPDASIQVEVETIDQLHQALTAGAPRILLDNFDLSTLRTAVAITQDRAELEASGNITLSQISSIAHTGIPRISIGSLTKHLRATDFTLQFKDH